MILSLPTEDELCLLTLDQFLTLFLTQKQISSSIPKAWCTCVYSHSLYLFLGSQGLIHLFRMPMNGLYLMLQEALNASLFLLCCVYVDLAGRVGTCLMNLFFLLLFFSLRITPMSFCCSQGPQLREKFIDCVSGHNHRRSWGTWMWFNTALPLASEGCFKTLRLWTCVRSFDEFMYETLLCGIQPR